MVVLHEVPQDAAQAGGDQVRGVAEEDCGFGRGFRVAPCSLGRVSWRFALRNDFGERRKFLTNIALGWRFTNHVIDYPDSFSSR